MRKTSNYLQWLPTSICGWFGLFPSHPPTNHDVHRQLHSILGQPPFKTPDPIDLNRILEHLFRLLGDPLRLLILVLVLIGIYLFLQMLSSYGGSEMNTRGLSAEASPKIGKQARSLFTDLYRQAMEDYHAKCYRQAVITLHKATVEYVLTKVITSSSGTKYTNNDLKCKLRGEERFYQPFAYITNYAEIAGFSPAEITQSDFESVLEVFKKSFLGQDARGSI